MKSLNRIALFVALIFAFSVAGKQAYSQPLTITVTYDSVSCDGLSDATAYVSEINNGSPPYTFIWYREGVPLADSDSILENINGGNYTAVVRDDLGEQDDEGFTIHNPSTIVIISVTPTDADCYGDSSGTISMFAINGTKPLKYSVDNGVTFQASNFFGNLPAADYNIVVSDKNVKRDCADDCEQDKTENRLFHLLPLFSANMLGIGQQSIYRIR